MAAAGKNLLRNMAKHIAHRVSAGRFRGRTKGRLFRLIDLGRAVEEVGRTDRSSGRSLLDEATLKIVYGWLSIFIAMKDKVVLQANESPGWPGCSLEGSITR
jgi:hypothetical protein